MALRDRKAAKLANRPKKEAQSMSHTRRSTESEYTKCMTTTYTPKKAKYA